MPEGGEELPAYLRIPLGQVVRAWRQERKLTLEELATAAGSEFTRGYLSQLETGAIQNPAGEKLAKVAAALELDPIVLVLRQFPDETSTTDERKSEKSRPASQESSPAAAHQFVADISALVGTLSALPAARQQQCVDALVTLVRALGQGDSG